MHRILDKKKSLVICQDSSKLGIVSRFIKTNSGKPFFIFKEFETLPYDHFSPHLDNLSNRIETLSKTNSDEILILTTTNALIQPLFDKTSVNNFSYIFEIKKSLDRDDLIKKLDISGYNASEIVSSRGEFAIRGSVIDIFPINSKNPIRINLEDNFIESIRTYDKDSQLGIHKINKYECKASKGFTLDHDSIKIFKKNWRSNFSNDGKIFDDVSKGRFPEGIESYFPLFYKEKPKFDDFFCDFDLFSFGNLEHSTKSYWHIINQRYEEFINNLDRPPLTPSILFNDPKEFLTKPFTEIIDEGKKQITIRKDIPESNNLPKIERETFIQEEQYEFKLEAKVVHLSLIHI